MALPACFSLWQLSLLSHDLVQQAERACLCSLLVPKCSARGRLICGCIVTTSESGHSHPASPSSFFLAMEGSDFAKDLVEFFFKDQKKILPMILTSFQPSLLLPINFDIDVPIN